MRELHLDNIPDPPLYRPAGADGGELFATREINGRRARVGALFSSPGIMEEFSLVAGQEGLEELASGSARELSGWEEVAQYALGGEDFVLVVSGEGMGLFYAEDVAERAREMDEYEFPFPLYLFSDEAGEAPLVRVEEETGELMVAALFTTPGKAERFRELREHLQLPESLATVEDEDGLRRHAMIARRAGADYAVIDPEFGHAEAIPLEELI